MFVGLSFPLYLEQIHKPCSVEVLLASEKAAELFLTGTSASAWLYFSGLSTLVRPSRRKL